MLVNCVICSDLFAPCDEVSITPCGHLFHFVCVTHWLERSKSCPQCRARTTEKTIHRVYFNVANNSDGTEDSSSLQNKIDTLTFEVRLKSTDIKNVREENTTLVKQKRGLIEEVKSLEEKLSTQHSTASALKQQVKFFQGESQIVEQVKNEAKRLRNQLQTLQNVDTIVRGTTGDVDELLKNHTVSSDSVRSLATYVSILKKEMKIITEKRKELRDTLRQTELDLRRIESEKDLLRSQVNGLTTTNKQLEGDLNHLEETKKSLQQKIEELEKAIMSPSDGNLRDKALRRLIRESPAPEELKRPRLTNPTSESFTPTRPIECRQFQDSVLFTPSPHLKLKASSVALPPLKTSQTSNFHVPANKFSIFKHARSVHPLLSTANVPEESYDGLGGHSKFDSFPTPLKGVAFKKTKSLSAIAKMRSMAPPQTLKLDNYFDLT